MPLELVDQCWHEARLGPIMLRSERGQTFATTRRRSREKHAKAARVLASQFPSGALGCKAVRLSFVLQVPDLELGSAVSAQGSSLQLWTSRGCCQTPREVVDSWYPTRSLNQDGGEILPWRRGRRGTRAPHETRPPSMASEVPARQTQVLATPASAARIRKCAVFGNRS